METFIPESMSQGAYPKMACKYHMSIHTALCIVKISECGLLVSTCRAFDNGGDDRRDRVLTRVRL